MPITAKRTIPEAEENIVFGDTIIRWTQQVLTFQFPDGKNYNHDISQGEWGHLKSIIMSLKNDIPNITDVDFPDYQ